MELALRGVAISIVDAPKLRLPREVSYTHYPACSGCYLQKKRKHTM